MLNAITSHLKIIHSFKLISITFLLVYYFVYNPKSSLARIPLPTQPAAKAIEGLYELPSYAVITAIEKAYIHEIEPIFSRKCFSCHTTNHKKEWYFKIPVLNKLITRNFERALEALDLSVGFPFIGKKSVGQTLIKLESSILDGSMPPPWWTIIFWHGNLSKAEKNSIPHWVQDGLKQVKLDK